MGPYRQIGPEVPTPPADRMFELEDVVERIEEQHWRWIMMVVAFQLLATVAVMGLLADALPPTPADPPAFVVERLPPPPGPLPPPPPDLAHPPLPSRWCPPPPCAYPCQLGGWSAETRTSPVDYATVGASAEKPDTTGAGGCEDGR